ncbi:hypothetical protein LXA43DRAFT_887460 [Ganoderma leucocontextum]|nr:hypothetical protein LXA43DRAFT_887460 [Ganoderma leucocontextum]
MSLVPWTVLQPDTIKAVIHDLGLAQFTSRTARKNDLVKLLQSIELEGLSPVRRRLRAQRDEPSYVWDQEREESPELEYSGPAPSTSSASVPAPVRPVVEIPFHVPSSPQSTGTGDTRPRAGRLSRTRTKGKARARPSPSELEQSPPPRPSRVGPPTKRKAPTTSTSAGAGAPSRKRARPETAGRDVVDTRKLPPVDLSNIPPPSYAILYQQRQSISQPRPAPWPRLNPHETFAGVDISPRRKEKRPRAGDANGAEDGAEGVSQQIVIEDVDGSEGLGGAAGGRGTRGTSTGTGTAASTTASVTRRMEAVVVTSLKTLKAKTTSSRRRTIVISDDEMDLEV